MNVVAQKQKRREDILHQVVVWARGDQGIVDRTRAALKEIDGYPGLYKCPCPGCKSRWPTEETASLHCKNATGKAHRRYRKDAEIVADSGNDMEASHQLPQEELRDFLLKNDPKRRAYRIENGVAEEWDHDAPPEKFRCPVCQLWFMSPERLENHLQNQGGKGS